VIQIHTWIPGLGTAFFLRGISPQTLVGSLRSGLSLAFYPGGHPIQIPWARSAGDFVWPTWAYLLATRLAWLLLRMASSRDQNSYKPSSEANYKGGLAQPKDHMRAGYSPGKEPYEGSNEASQWGVWGISHQETKAIRSC
jgi:hypothetical protein